MSLHHQLTIAVCDHFRPEVAAVLAEEGLPGVELISWIPRCTHPARCHDELMKSIEAQHPKTQLLVISGCQLRGVPSSFQAPSHVQFHNLEQCFHLLCGKTQVEQFTREGGYLVSGGWLANWPQHLEQWGFNQPNAQLFFHDNIRKLVFLDTGVSATGDDDLIKFAEFVGLPFSRVSIGLDYVTFYLKSLILGLHNRQLENRIKTNQEQAANYALAINLFNDLTDKVAQFSHGICDKCLEEKYPSVKEK